MPVLAARLRKRTAAIVALVLGMAACGPERRAAEDDAADDPDVPWLMGVFTRQAVGTSFSTRFSTQYEFREGGEGVVWENGQNGMSRRPSADPNLRWEAQGPTRVRVEQLEQRGGNPFIVAPTSNCNELRRGDVVNMIEPSDGELLEQLYRGELCVTSSPEAIGGQYEFDYCDAPPPPCDEQPD